MIKIYSLSAFKPAVKGVIRDIRPVWTLEELGMPYERIVLDPVKREHKTTAYLALNPFGKVPTMVDQDFTLFESSAICTYLGDKVGKLLPNAGTRDRALFNQWVSFSTTTLEPQAFRVFGFDFFSEMDAAKKILRDESLQAVSTFLGVIDKELIQRPYLLGSDFSIADIIFGSVCRVVFHTGVGDQYPSLRAYLSRIYTRPAFETANEKNGT